MILDTRNLPILPVGWTVADLEQISEINPKISADDYSEEIDVSFVPMRCVEELTGRIELSLKRKLSEVKKGYTSFTDGDLLFAKITPCMENGKIAVVNDLTNGIGFGSTEFHVIRLHEVLPKHFAFYYLIQEDLRKDAQRNMTGSAGQLRVPANYMRELILPFPPLSEQQRIVDKIEELFTKLDAGVEALKKIKEQLKRYRQAVLKYAFEGKLTEEWREQHKGELEPASVLLERIKEERKKTLGKKYKELPPVDTSELPELPDGWVWTRMIEISEKITDGTHHTPTYVSEGIPFISVKDIKNGMISFENCKFISEDEHNVLIKRCNPEYGDVLITKSGTIGRTAVVTTRDEFSLFVSVALIKPYKDFLDSNFIKFALDNYINNIDIQQSVKGGVVKNLHIEDLKEINIITPSIEEQYKVVEEIQCHFSIADEIEKTVDQSLKQSDRLRQSILKKAFEGKLVHQDPFDEPAELLLERIRAEKAAMEAEKKITKKPRRKKADTRQGRLI
ncbi:MAG: restriction endonuclease subunit S [Syntrophaceae bacterium]|nr:restriction endonuclease subunit S [Syntrophaceae bacterium]